MGTGTFKHSLVKAIYVGHEIAIVAGQSKPDGATSKIESAEVRS